MTWASGYLGVASSQTVIPAPSWTHEADQADAHLGFSLCSAGDVNGDGYSDVLVGIPDMDGGQTDEGVVLLFLGANTGLSLVPEWTQESDQPGARYGFSVASAGDVNGDGFSDILVGAPDFDTEQGDEGAVFLYLGSAGGLPSAPSHVWNGDRPGARFGAAVSGAGDVNADGFDDVIIGAPGFDGGESEEGAAFLFLGAASEVSPAHAWSVEGGQAGASLGMALAGIEDANGDGFDDVVIAAPHFDGGLTDAGQIRIFGGEPLGLGAVPLQSFESNEGGSRFGFSVAGGGDLTGAGAPRILYGAPNYAYTHQEEGGTFLGTLGQAPFFLDFGRQDFAHRGTSIASAGDLNADGLKDVVIGADLFDAAGGQDEGRVTVHLGHPSFVVDRTPAWVMDGGQPFCAFGSSVASAGDVNGDGYDDVLVGAPHYDHGESDEGRAFLFMGPAGQIVGVDHRGLGGANIRAAGPNPFRSVLQLAYTTPRRASVHLSVWDVLGRQRATLVSGEKESGTHLVTWSGRGQDGVDGAAGIYFVRLEFEGRVAMLRAVLIR